MLSSVNYKILPDDILLLHLRMDDEAAFREVYLRYWKKLYSIATRKIQSTVIAEELTQDIFLRLWESRKAQKIENLNYYLLASVRNAVINHFRKVFMHEKYFNYADYHFSKSTDSTDEQIALNDLIEIVEKQLNELPEKTRQIFKLNRLEYKSVKEISAQLSIPERTVEYHISQAVKFLRVFLKDYLLPSIFIFLFF